MARFTEGMTLGVKRYGGTEMDHKIRGATNSVQDAKTLIQRHKERMKGIMKPLEAELKRLEKDLKEAEALLAELKKAKKKEEPGTGTPGLPRFRTPGGIPADLWRFIRIAGKDEEFKSALAEGKEMEWLENFKEKDLPKVKDLKYKQE